MTRTIRYEHAVYGSFAFWNRGYAILAHSVGCQDRWLAALKLAGQRFGERPPGVAEQACLFALCLRGGPWMIVGVFPQGDDDQGRPGALAFHGIFVPRWTYWRCGSSPFPFASAFRRDWNSDDQDRVLPLGSLALADRQPSELQSPDRQVEIVVEAIKSGRKVVLLSPRPIDDLARSVWRKLPGRITRRASVATWAFSTSNGFDLTAVPKLAGIVSDSPLLVLETDSEIAEGWSMGRDVCHAK